MISKTRELLKPLINAVAKPIALTGVNPDLFSFLAVPLAVIAGYFLVQQNFVYSFIFACLAISIDLFDGAVARLQKKETLFGNYVETILDKLVEVILLISAAFIHPIAAATAIGFSMLAAYAKPRVGLVIITDNRDWRGVGEHAERMVLLLLGLLFSVFSIVIDKMKILEIFLWLIALFSIVGGIQRIAYAKTLIAEAEHKGTVLPYLKSAKKGSDKRESN